VEQHGLVAYDDGTVIVAADRTAYRIRLDPDQIRPDLTLDGNRAAAPHNGRPGPEGVEGRRVTEAVRSGSQHSRVMSYESKRSDAESEHQGFTLHYDE
jgi:hypothetical protein